MTQITELKPSDDDMEFICDICNKGFYGNKHNIFTFKFDKESGEQLSVTKQYTGVCEGCHDNAVEVINNLIKGW